MRKRLFQLSLLLFIGITVACTKEGDKTANQLPDTTIAPHSINLQGKNRLNSRVRLTWHGSDQDGYITGFEFSTDNSIWTYTKVQDSTFKFTLNAGSDTTDIQFYIRSIDNEGGIDPTPAFLKIPLKNTPPVVNFDDKSLPKDTAHIAYTFRWFATDLDGDNSISKAYLKINNGTWTEISKGINLITVVPSNPSATGVVSSDVYYGTKEQKSLSIDGLNLNGTNRFYLKVTDIAGSESKIDTSDAVFIKNKSADLLLIGGIAEANAKLYKQTLNKVYPTYDALDFEKNSGENQPKFWNPTFFHMTRNYDKIVFFSDQSFFLNPINGQNSSLLEFAAPFLQKFTNQGGKTLISSTFDPTKSIENIKGIMPLDSLDSSFNQAYLHPDSSIASLIGNKYPDLQSSILVLGLDPFYVSTDAEAIYRARLASASPWTGPYTVGARRKNGANYFQYFFSVPLNELNKNTADLEKLFNQILNNDFNW